MPFVMNDECGMTLPGNQPGKYGGTALRGGYEWVCHQGWRRGLLPNYIDQSCCDDDGDADADACSDAS